jgi:hypothetical protein
MRNFFARFNRKAEEFKDINRHELENMWNRKAKNYNKQELIELCTLFALVVAHEGLERVENNTIDTSGL